MDFDPAEFGDRVKSVVIQTGKSGIYLVYFVDGDPRAMYHKDHLVWKKGGVPTPMQTNVLWQARDKFNRGEFV